jgi:phosphate transport system protein
MPAPNAHTDREYERELVEIRERLLLMAGRVEEMIHAAVDALLARDVALARETVQADRKVNRDEVEIDKLCLVILARRQPMASDLRFITLALKMVIDLERIGDLAVNICERVVDLEGEPYVTECPDLGRMSELVRSMIHDAVEAFVDREPDKAAAVIERDDEVDDLYQTVFRMVLDEMIGDARNVSAGVHLQSVAKWLERMGDHCTNLAEQIVFMTKGKDIRHVGKLEPR